MDFKLRHPLTKDIPALRDIWISVFGADDADLFFSRYFNPEFCVAITVGDKPVAAGYLFCAGDAIQGGATLPCVMIYGVATLPEFRNNGFGTAVVRSLIETGYAAGYPAVALCPSEDSLFEYYSARTMLHSYFYIHEQTLKAPLSANANYGIAPVPAAQYGEIRSDLLAGIPHLNHNDLALVYQELLCSLSGGGLFRIKTPAGDSCAVIERLTSGSVCLKELLVPPGSWSDDLVAGILSVIAPAFPAREYTLRSPALFSPSEGVDQPVSGMCIEALAPGLQRPGPVIRRFGMLAAPESFLDPAVYETGFPWLGIAFD